MVLIECSSTSLQELHAPTSWFSDMSCSVFTRCELLDEAAEEANMTR
jgi:hypothetical protein